MRALLLALVLSLAGCAGQVMEIPIDDDCEVPEVPSEPVGIGGDILANTGGAPSVPSTGGLSMGGAEPEAICTPDDCNGECLELLGEPACVITSYCNYSTKVFIVDLPEGIETDAQISLYAHPDCLEGMGGAEN